MAFSINITGVVGEIDEDVHKFIHKYTEEFAEKLRQLEGIVSVDSVAVTTPTLSANLAHQQEAAADAPAAAGEAGTVAAGTATVSGTDLKTGDGVHADTAGSPPGTKK